MAFLNYVQPPSGEGGVLAAKAIGGLILSAALAASDPATVTPVAEWLNARPSTVWAALIGATMFALLSDGPPRTRLRRAAVSFLFAYLFTDGFLEWRGWATPAAERTVAGTGGAVGVLLLESVMRFVSRARDVAPAAFDAAADAALSRIAPGAKIDKGGDDAGAP